MRHDELEFYYEGFKRELHDLTADFLQKATSPNSDINSLWTDFKCKIHELMEKYIPQKLIRGTKTKKPWIDKQMESLWRKRNKLFKKQKSSHRPKDVSNYKQMRARVQKAERQAYWRHIENLIEIGDPEKDQNPGKQKWFWSFIKSLRKDNCGVAPLKENGKMHSDLKDKAYILNRQYESTFTREDTSNIPQPRGEPCSPMPDIIVTEEGVAKLLRKINPNKACGPDMIPARILKELAEEISASMTAIFQKSLTLALFQTIGGLQTFQPFPRKGTVLKPVTTALCHWQVCVVKFRNTSSQATSWNTKRSMIYLLTANMDSEHAAAVKHNWWPLCTSLQRPQTEEDRLIWSFLIFPKHLTVSPSPAAGKDTSLWH